MLRYLFTIIFLFALLNEVTVQQASPQNPTGSKKARPRDMGRPKFNTRQEQQKYQEIKRRRAELQEKRRAEMGDAAVPEKQPIVVEVNITNKVIGQERKRREDLMKQMGDSFLMGKNLQNFRFQIDKNQAEFIIKYLNSMEIAVLLRSYVNQEGFFKPVSDVETAGSVKTQLYDLKSKRLISEAEFYFLGEVKFQAQAGVQYQLIVSSFGKGRLLEVSVPRRLTLVELGGGYLGTAMNEEHLQDIGSSFQKVTQSLQQLRKMNSLSFVNSKHMEKQMHKYSTFQIVEMAIIIVLTLIQLQLIKRLFASNTSIL